MRCVSGLHEWIGADDVVHGMRWERQSLRQWLDSEGLRYQLRLSGPQSLNCLRLARAGDGWVAALWAVPSGFFAPQRVPVPAGVLIDATTEEAYG